VDRPETQISFVQDCDDLVRHPRQEVVDLLLLNQGSGWVVRIGNEDDFSFGVIAFNIACKSAEKFAVGVSMVRHQKGAR